MAKRFLGDVPEPLANLRLRRYPCSGFAVHDVEGTPANEVPQRGHSSGGFDCWRTTMMHSDNSKHTSEGKLVSGEAAQSLRGAARKARRLKGIRHNVQ
jgi:hypothetical protein